MDVTYEGDGFSPTNGNVRTVVTNIANKITNSPATAWVPAQTARGFTVCATSVEVGAAVDYIAVQGESNKRNQQTRFGENNNPFRGGLFGEATFESDGSTTCETVQFDGGSFGAGGLAKVVGSLNVGGISWIEKMDYKGFRVCAKGASGTVTFHWLAVEHKNPRLWWGNRLPYSGAGTERSSTLTSDTSGDDDKGDKKLFTTDWTQVTNTGAGLWKVCHDVAFGTVYPQVPQVMVTAVTGSETAKFTWVETVSLTGFKVCAATSGHAVPADLTWEWISFDRHSVGA
jgi:hypothetical protein